MMERFLQYFVPEKYKLDLNIDKEAKTLSGVVVISGVVEKDVIKLHAVDFEIESVFINDEKAKYNYDSKELIICNVHSGKADIEVKYKSALNENMQGAYLSTYEYEGKTETIVVTQFESHYAREAFPCVDEPAAKAVFELSITTNESNLVLSNMPELRFSSGSRPTGPSRSVTELPRSKDRASSVLARFVVPSPRAVGAQPRAAALRKSPSQTLASGLRTTTFQPTPRMSTYLLAWVVGKLHGKTIKNKHGVEVTTYAPFNQDVDSVDFANEVAARALEFYDDNFGIPYPLKKLDQVAIPDFEAGAMENWGLVTYRESMLLASNNSSLGTKKAVALTVTHELAHQWFGDLVTMEWWDDLWLNESFASVMEYYATDYICPEYNIFESFFVGDALAALRRDAYEGVQSVRQDVNNPEEIATLFDAAIVYAKGARLMLMLIRLMGWKEFCKGIKDYFEEHKYANAVGDDLWKALQPYADFNVKELMHAFIDKPGYPVITCGKDSKDYSQKRFLLDTEMTDSDWPIPEISQDMSGHYILNLSNKEFEERLENFDNLSLEEKLRLLIDRSLIVKTDLASASSLLPLLLKFKDEPSAAVWSIVALLVSTLKPFFEYGSDSYKKYTKYVKKLVEKKLDEIGLVTRKNDDENTMRLREILLALDYYAEDNERLKKLAKMYNRDYTKMDSEIRASIYDAKIYCEPEIMDELIDLYKSVSDPEVKYEILFALTLSHNKEKLEEMMKYLNDIDTVKPQDQLYLFIYLFRNPLIKMRVFHWLTENWDFVKDLAGDKTLENYPRYTASGIRTEEEFSEYSKFFEPMKKNSAVSRAIEIGINEIRAQLEFIEKDKNAVYGKLDEIIK